MSDVERCISCHHVVTFDGYNYRHKEDVESFTCTGTNRVEFTNKQTNIRQVIDVGCICINPRGSKHRDLHAQETWEASINI